MAEETVECAGLFRHRVAGAVNSKADDAAEEYTKARDKFAVSSSTLFRNEKPRQVTKWPGLL